ncbi:MAG: PD-(D/E)XK nuclease family protein [Vampirovibrionales bacterium]|jgi:hypothetical protein|nr:PD-(D/E)XK nuclease family protein [Vampirovibrionales bacterium]
MTIKTVQTLNPTAENPWVVSVNQLKEWDKCHAQFYYKTVLKQRWLSDERNFELGKAVHALMDLHAKGLPTEHLRVGLKPNILAHFDALLEHPLAKAPVVTSEYAFYLPFSVEGFPHITLTGRIDRISLYNGSLAIIDWKTGTAVPHDYATAWQTRLYSYAIWHMRDALPLPKGEGTAEIHFYYVDVRTNRQPAVKVYDVTIDAVYIAETEGLLKQVLARILAEKRFALPSACPDKYCRFSQVCGINPETTAQLPLFSLPQASVLGQRVSDEANPLDLF